MKLSSIHRVKEDERGTMYDCDKINFISRKEGSISADHSHENEIEVLFLIEGEIELNIGKEIEIVKAPIKIEIPSNTHHKLKALTDIKLLEYKKQ